MLVVNIPKHTLHTVCKVYVVIISDDVQA